MHFVCCLHNNTEPNLGHTGEAYSPLAIKMMDEV